MHPLERRSEQTDAQRLGFGLRHDAPPELSHVEAAADHWVTRCLWKMARYFAGISCAR